MKLGGGNEAEGKEKGKECPGFKFACEPMFRLLFNHDIPSVDAASRY